MDHKDHHSYWAEVAPILNGHIEKNRDPDFEAALVEAVALYSFVQETFRAKATKNQELAGHLAPMMVETHDILRMLPSAMAELSPVTLAALARISFEVHCNLTFIAKSDEPAKWAHRYVRFSQVQKLLREAKRPDDRPAMFSEGELATIRKSCNEWIRVTKKGKEEILTYWTADEDVRTVRQIAKHLGMLGDYATLYSATSAFVHGASLVGNLYLAHGGFGSVGSPPVCKRLAYLAVHYGVKTLLVASQFFAVSIPQDAFDLWRGRLVESCRELLQTP